MPATNPLVSLEDDVGESWTFATAPMQGAVSTDGGAFAMNPMGTTQTSSNAAGTAENVALHVAIIVAIALVGVYVFRASGFRFVVAGGIGR